MKTTLRNYCSFGGRLTLLEICRYLRQIRPGFKVLEVETTTGGGKGCVKVCVVIPNDF